MATISLCIRESQRNADGTFTIKIAVGAKSRMTYIATQYRIGNIKQWKDGKVIKHSDANYINKQLKKLLWEYEAIYEAMPNPNVSAAEIRQYLLHQYRKSNLLKDYAEKYVARLEKEERIPYAKNMAGTVKYLLECLDDTVTLQVLSSASENLSSGRSRRGYVRISMILSDNAVSRQSTSPIRPTPAKAI